MDNILFMKKHNSNIISVPFYYYLVPFFLYNEINHFFNNERLIKGFAFNGVSHYVITGFLSSIFLLLFINFLWIFNEKLTNFKLFKEVIISPMFILWLTTLLLKILYYEVFNGYVEIFIFIIIAFLQKVFVKRLQTLYLQSLVRFEQNNSD